MVVAVILQSQGTSTEGVWLLGLIVLTIAAVATAKGWWRLYNLGIILAFMLVGIGIGLVAAMWGRNNAIGGNIAASLMVCLGAVGALGCWRRNNMRAKASKELEGKGSDGLLPAQSTLTSPETVGGSSGELPSSKP